PMIRMAMKKVDNDYEEILYLYSRRCLGQINKLKHLLISSDLQLEDIEHFNCDIQNAYNNIKDVFEARSHKYSE
ncbi:hypothetical protein ACT3RM_09870, partial [Pseudoalteromonas sp. AOP7-A1-14]